MANINGRREKGMGTIYQRENGTYVGRITVGLKSDGKPKTKCFSGKSKVSVETYFLNWLKVYKKDYLKSSSYDILC